MYTFKCLRCGTEVEQHLSALAKPHDYPNCPACGGLTVRQISQRVGVSLKGTGWSKDSYSCTDRGAERVSIRADRKGKIVSFPGQTVKGRDNK